MPDATGQTLRGKRLLIVEDEYLIAADLAEFLEEQGAVVIGPAPTVKAALALLEREPRIDGAVLDINLRGERSYPVADRLMGQGVSLVFTTGYESVAVPGCYASIVRLSKPVDRTALVARLLAAMGQGQSSPACP